MADTISIYNHTTKKLLDLSMADEANNFYCELLDGTTAFSAAHTTKDQVDDSGADEIAGNGWASGGVNLTTVVVTTTDTSSAKFDADDIVVTAASGSIGPAAGAVIYLDENNAGTTLSPMWYITFEGGKTAVETEDFSMLFSTNGISKLSVV